MRSLTYRHCGFCETSDDYTLCWLNNFAGKLTLEPWSGDRTGLFTAKGGFCATLHMSAARAAALRVSGIWVPWHWWRSCTPQLFPGKETSLYGLKMICALVTLPAPLCSAALPARRQLLLRPKQLIQKMIESICSLAAFPSSSSCTALVTLGLKSWHECRDAPHSLSIFISMSIAVICQHFLHNIWEHFENSASCLSKILVKHGFHSALCSRVKYLLGMWFQRAS